MVVSQVFYLIHFHNFQVDTDTKYHAAARTGLLHRWEQATGMTPAEW